MFKPTHHLLTISLAVVLSGPLMKAQQADPPKVIIDTDFNTMFDDGQVAVMAAQLYSQGAIDLLGFTIASGNQWRDQEVSDCLKAMERLGIEDRVKVYVGSQYPLLHNYQSFLYEEFLYGQPIDYVGAFAGPQPTPSQIVPPPDGLAKHTKPAEKDAVDFMIEAIHCHPHEVTILEIAPPTNLAIAIRKDPTIVPLIKQVITMAGQMYVAGNAYLDTAEFNWWFDPEATQIVLRAGVPHYIIPLDCTNTLPLTKEIYLQIVQHQPQTIVTKLYQQAYAPFFGSGPPPYVPYIFDTTAFAFLVDPTLATDVRDLWVDVNTTFDPYYGQSVVHTFDSYPSIGLLQPSKVIFHLDNARFNAFYVDLLTRPVPVRFDR
ncbi:MAG: nucleoside hydrolase [Acidobacteriaceae bacterium]|nr:nucleoside hydrolase [Verrucomicrobiota bacterium]MBV8569032.1 nucleoside hydrolase [Acidobacteriaceae bacterium]